MSADQVPADDGTPRAALLAYGQACAAQAADPDPTHRAHHKGEVAHTFEQVERRVIGALAIGIRTAAAVPPTLIVSPDMHSCTTLVEEVNGTTYAAFPIRTNDGTATGCLVVAEERLLDLAHELTTEAHQITDDRKRGRT